MRRLRSQNELWPYALIGAEAIHYELIALKSTQVPPVRTIHDWLVKADLVTCKPAESEKRASQAMPLPPANTVNAVQQLDLKGPVYLRGSGHKYYLGVLRDRYSRRCAVAALNRRASQGITDFLVASWQWLGLPTYLQMDNIAPRSFQCLGARQYLIGPFCL